MTAARNEPCSRTGNTPSSQGRGVMWRALLAFVAVMLAVGLYALFTGGPAEPTQAA